MGMTTKADVGENNPNVFCTTRQAVIPSRFSNKFAIGRGAEITDMRTEKLDGTTNHTANEKNDHAYANSPSPFWFVLVGGVGHGLARDCRGDARAAFTVGSLGVPGTS